MALYGKKGTLAATAVNPLIGQGSILTPSTKAPEAQIVDFDQGTKDLLNTQMARGDQSIEQIADQQTAGMDEKARSFMDASRVQDNSRTSLGAGSSIPDELNTALTARLARKYGDNSALIKSRARQDAIETKLKNTQSAINAASAITQQKAYAHATKLRNVAAKKQARAQALSSVLGMAGMAVGAGFGGSQGAMAGGQIGQGVGQNVGGK